MNMLENSIKHITVRYLAFSELYKKPKKRRR